MVAPLPNAADDSKPMTEAAPRTEIGEIHRVAAEPLPHAGATANHQSPASRDTRAVPNPDSNADANNTADVVNAIPLFADTVPAILSPAWQGLAALLDEEEAEAWEAANEQRVQREHRRRQQQSDSEGVVKHSQSCGGSLNKSRLKRASRRRAAAPYAPSASCERGCGSGGGEATLMLRMMKM